MFSLLQFDFNVHVMDFLPGQYLSVKVLDKSVLSRTNVFPITEFVL
jgi:NAD(P)H-flavin reductase